MSVLRRPLVIALALRAAIMLVLAGGLLWAAGSDAEVVATIAATVILVSLILSGAVMVWLAEFARRKAVPGAAWLTAQGATVLLAGMVAPVLLIDDPLIHSAVVLWIFAGTLFASGVLECISSVARRVSWGAGGTQVGGAALLAAVIWLRENHALTGMIGSTGLIVWAVGLLLVWCAVDASRWRLDSEGPLSDHR
ncbi:hypothetical protein [Corynebacterium doosanense]|uniref:Uncharacterized protein n=1 Tax=Corynebacterium doosanense CAU 212 = DSM 45436 TaxID=558173 RepID=A0A097IJN8_9CORY|nr:hypothetical protein [Corynebacterium doosanense]AIT62318.1 hypothetical protein CDOO_10840 [Corynebacterium doosanense CAU 212 = DSM 45436]